MEFSRSLALEEAAKMKLEVCKSYSDSKGFRIIYRTPDAKSLNVWNLIADAIYTNINKQTNKQQEPLLDKRHWQEDLK